MRGGYSAEHRQAQQQMTQQYLQRQQQQQQQQQSGAQAASGGTPTVGNETTIEISGCADPTIGVIARGMYAYVTQNHGRPAYKKTEQVNGVDVMIYYWDERDGPTFSGWWLGPQIGGDQVWAYQPDRSAPYVPSSGWKVPYHADVDPTFVVAKAKSAPTAMAEQQRKQQEQKKLQQMQEQQKEEQQRRQEEQRKKFQEETLRKQQEQQAVAAVRRVMQKMWTVTEDNFETLKAEVDNALVQNTTNLGSQLEKMKGDIKTCIDQAQKQIEEAKEAKRKQQEQIEKTRSFAEKIQAQLEAVDAEIATLRETLEEFETACKEQSDSAEAPEAWISKYSESIAAAKEKAKVCSDKISDEVKEMRSADGPQTPDPQMASLTARTSECGRRLSSLLTSATFAVQRAKKKAEAKAKMVAIESVFDKYDSNKDGFWSTSDAKKYAQGEMSLKLSDELLKPALRALGAGKEGIKKADFHRLKMALGIVRERQIDEVRRADRLKREKELEGLKAALQSKVDDASAQLKEIEEKVNTLDELCTPLSDKALSGSTPAEISKMAAEVGDSAQDSHSQLESLKPVVANLTEEVDPSIKAIAAMQQKALDFRVRALESKVTKAQKAVAHARNVGEKKGRQELIAIEGRVLAVLRNFQREKSQTTQEMFAAASGDKDASLDLDGFKSFFQEAQDAVTEKDGEEKATDKETFSDGDLERVFSLWKGAQEGLTEELFSDQVRLYYKVLKDASIAEGVDVESSALIRLEVGDIVEALCGGPSLHKSSGCSRMRAKALKDGTEGYVTTCGNGGTKFLQEVTEFRVVSDTALAKTFDIEEDKEKQRTLKVGEVVEVKRWPVKDEKTGLTRLKCRCKGHLEYGFATSVGNRGAVFLQMI